MGWNSTAAASVVTSDRHNSLPMLDVPGWLDSHRLAKVVAVVIALNTTARVSDDARGAGLASSPGEHIVDLERHP